MLHVAFTHDAFRMQRFGGVPRYLARLHTGLLDRGHSSDVLAGLHLSSYLRGLDGVHGLNVAAMRPRRPVKALTRIVDPIAERVWTRRLSAGSILHATYYSDRPLRHRPFVVTVYDMIHEIHSGDFAPDDPTPRRKRRMCEMADLVLTISERTRTDLLDRVSISPDRAVVTRLGVDSSPASVGDITSQRRSDRLLFVGDRTRRYKNFSALVQAMTVVDSGVRLVCFGPAPTSSEQQLIARLGLESRVIWTGGDDNALDDAYRHSRALICPSLYEGFGLPVLEAMARGCPVVGSSIDVLQEVHGGNAFEFDPYDTDSMASAIGRAFVDDTGWARLRDGGLQHSHRQTWDVTVDRTIAAYRTLVPEVD